MHVEAVESFDDMDRVNAPHFQDFAEMNFVHPEYFMKNFSQDVVHTQSEYMWEFNVDTNLKDLAVFTWSDIDFENKDKELFLLDIQTQTLVNMRETKGFAFNSEESSRFKIFFGTNVKSKIKPNRILLGKAFPNPSTGITTIPFSLPDQGGKYQVSLEVYDLMGKKVNTIISGVLTSGFYTSEWDASLGNLTNGIYIYRLAVSNSLGSEVQSGKIVINK